MLALLNRWIFSLCILSILLLRNQNPKAVKAGILLYSLSESISFDNSEIKSIVLLSKGLRGYEDFILSVEAESKEAVVLGISCLIFI